MNAMSKVNVVTQYALQSEILQSKNSVNKTKNYKAQKITFQKSLS